MTKAEESSIKTDMLMQVYYGQLSEKDRRQFAAFESLKMGRGGRSHISKLLGVHRNTIKEGIRELEAGLEASAIPQAGKGGRAVATPTGIMFLKHQLMKFAQQTGLSVVVCHYPPYCSKWNPIEHRLFSQVHRAMEGAVFSDYQTVQKLIEQTSTRSCNPRT